MKRIEMTNPHHIIIFGANGSGKSALGQELARVLNCKHMDVEDYHFIKSEIPYTVVRSREECLDLMLEDIEKYHSFVLSAVTGDFGDEISSMYDLAVFLVAPIETRMERIGKREYIKHGDRISIDKWAETLTCPIIHVDGTHDYKKTATDLVNRCYKA